MQIKWSKCLNIEKSLFLRVSQLLLSLIVSPVVLGKCSVISAKSVCDVTGRVSKMLGTTCVGTETPALGLFKDCLLTFYHLKHAFCLVYSFFSYGIN